MNRIDRGGEPECEHGVQQAAGAMRRGLQIDHRAPWTPTRDTSLANLARLCRWHHYQKSHLGYRYRGGPGTWEWIPPDEPIGPPTFPP